MTPCCWKNCRSTERAVTWLERDLCGEHWNAVCVLRDNGMSAEEIKRIHTKEKVSDEI